MSNTDPFQGSNNGAEENTEDERMRKGYEQLERDLKKERWEQRKRKRKEEWNRMVEEWNRMGEERRKVEEAGRRMEAAQRRRMRRRHISASDDEEIRSKPKDEWEKEEEEEWTRKWREKENKEKEEKEKEEERKKEAADRAYEKLQVEVKKYDDGMVLGWKEDIDTLLVFAGLFSAVVTAFLIESYQWLSEDTTVVILTQISQQLNGTQTQSTPFTPEASSIRINCFWFLSLIFSLTSALFGLLCKQWLREHQRDVPTRTVAENLALRQLRRDSFEKWGVASFLSALPILLEIALVFFFVGVLDLLWTLHPIVFGICLAAISLSMGLYFLTTILPTITIPCNQAQFLDTQDEHDIFIHYHDFGQLTYQFICPYKSPQAWAVYKLFTTLPKPLLRFPFINNFTKTHLRPLWDHFHARTSSWSTFDLRVVRQFDQEVCPMLGISFQLQVYELRALQWAVTMFRDSPSMIPHLENVLETLPRSVAVSAVLDRWDIAMWAGQEVDVGAYLRYPTGFSPLPGPTPVTCDTPLHSGEGIELLFWHRLWGFSVGNGLVDLLTSSLEDFTQKLPKSSRKFQFFIPLPLATALWSHEETRVRQGSLLLLRHFEESWKPSPGYDEERHNEERVAFANGLAEHICRSDLPSVLLTSKRGQEFIRFINHEIIIRRLYFHRRFGRGVWWESEERGYGWIGTLKNVQNAGSLPDNYFAPFPEEDEAPPPSSQLPQLEPIRYSVDTLPLPFQFRYYPRNDIENSPGIFPSHSPAGDVHKNIVMDTLRTIWNNARSLVGIRNRDHADEHTGDNALAGTDQDVLGELQILQHPGEGPHTANDNVQEGHATSGSMAGLSDVPHQASTSSLRDQGNDSRIGSNGGNGASTSRADDVQKSGGIQVHESWGNATSEVADDTSPNQGVPESQAANESPVLPSDSDERAASRAVAGGTDSDHPEDLPTTLSTTGGDEPDVVPGGIISLDSDPDRAAPVSDYTAGNIASPAEEQGEQARHDHEEQMMVGIRGTADLSSSQDQGQRRLRRDEGRGSNKINDPNHLRMFRL
ncbi:hypothetical protein VNI00_014243 [Paramarasmius palmivorus]|uniref:DUF6535 domain-containing protein n=1 Tax=Paramarasmius palmivorus TaxID=297713 RepID=A0AAW0BVN4_9AGAR